jgi:hypothetical protein
METMLDMFVYDCVVKSENEEILVDDMYSFFMRWCEGTHVDMLPTRKLFQEYLSRELGTPCQKLWFGYKLRILEPLEPLE